MCQSNLTDSRPLRRERMGGATSTIVFSLATVAMLAGGAVIWTRTGLDKQPEDDSLVESVARRDFRLEITENGETESAGNVEIRCEVKSNNTTGTAILRLVPEGTFVKAGDFLAQLDASALEKEKIQQRILVNTSEAKMIQARNVYETAVIAKKEYLEGTFSQERMLIESEAFVAEENLRRAEEYLQYSRRLFAKGYVTELQLEADRFAVEKAKKDVEVARTKLNVLEAFTKVKMVKQLESDILTAKAQWEAEKSSHELESNKLKDIEDQIAKCLITAPNEGQVTYGHKRDRRGDTDVIIEEGAIVRERQPIIRLPDTSRMQVKIEVNESVVDLVRVGMRASIRSVGRDDVTLPGTVTQVNEYSEPTSYWQGNIKNFAAYVRVDHPSELLRVGMTAQVTIHCETIPDVLQVPVQAVYAHGPQLNYCFVRTPAGWEHRQVKLGPTNDRYVVIQQGLTENEQVSLNPRRYLPSADLPKLAADEQQQVVKNSPRFDETQDTAKRAERQGRGATDAGALASQLMQRLDANADGLLNADELPAMMQANLKAADTNGDGAVDRGELAAAAGRLARLGPRPPGGGDGSGGAE